MQGKTLQTDIIISSFSSLIPFFNHLLHKNCKKIHKFAIFNANQMVIFA